MKEGYIIRDQEKINLLENLFGRSLAEGLDYIEIAVDNESVTTVRDNDNEF